MLVVLNNKCNFLKNEFEKYIKKLPNNKNIDLVVCPSNIYLTNDYLKNFIIGSQNVSKNKNGAHTGEISATQLKSLGVRYTIVGHHERRIDEYETSTDINKKIKNLISAGIIPILCVGESYEERINLDFITILKSQLKEELSGISKKNKEKVVIAYEPNWCIGKKQIPSMEKVENVISEIKKNYPNNKIIYGGGVNNKTIDILSSKKIFDGYLLGELGLYSDKLNTFLKKL